MYRKEVTDSLLYSFASVMTKEQLEKVKTSLEKMSDYDFWQLVAEAKQSVPSSGLTMKEYLNAINTLQKSNGVERKNSGMNYLKANYMPVEYNKKIIKEIECYFPSDVINLTEQEDNMIIDLWEKGSKEKITIPSDLFFAGTIPLTDVKISVDERNSGGVLIKYRVIIFDDYADRAKSASEECEATVGVILIPVGNTDNGEFIVPICVVKGVDFLPIAPIGFRNVSQRNQIALKNHLNQAQIGQMVISLLETWYGIQIALLHPEVKEVFQNPQTVRDYDGTKNKPKSNKKPRVRYIKKHIINKDELEKRIYGTKKAIKRQALLWYVIGHWRTYKEGRKVFIQPYWKGALRNEKSVVEAREREIVVKNEAVEAR